MCLTTERMITREYAEHELVLKRPAMEANQKRHCAKKRQEEERRVVVPPAAVGHDHDEASEDGTEGVSLPLTVAATPAVTDIDDGLDDGEPLSTISDDDNNPFGFFETLPIPSSSRCHL